MGPIDLLIKTGELLYGVDRNDWMPALAADLNVDRETLRKWVVGKRRVPLEYISDRLVDLIDVRMLTLNELRLKYINNESENEPSPATIHSIRDSA